MDGAQIKGGSKTLTGDEHRIYLGKYQHALRYGSQTMLGNANADVCRVKWIPTVLSFSFSSKELKAKDPLATYRSRLEDLDIKTIIPYVAGKTTHVVQNKRNTAKGLQALINGKYIVQDSYIDALVYAATPNDLEALESLSPLEEDFDAAWPDPAEHLPPPGKEPVHRPAEAFAPNPDRAHVFEGYTFVFCDTSQFENLQPPINNGHGKALLYQLEYGQTKPEELVQFMKNAAGEKGSGSERQRNGGVVLVRFRAKGEFEEWSIDLGNQVALITDQRVIEQSEFLDAILNNDASLLCRPLPREEVPSRIRETTEVASTRQQASERITSPAPAAQSDETSSQPAPTQTSRRARSRPFVSKVKTFDDGFDINSIPEYTLETGDGSAESNPVRRECGNLRSSSNLSQAQSQADVAPAGTSQMEEDDGMADLLPGANAMKRRREEMGLRAHSEETAQPKEEMRKPKRQKLDVLEAARRRREEVEAAARGHSIDEPSSLQVAIEGMTLDEMKKLVVVEEMDVPLRGRQSPTVEETERWDERWNGRKNFKKFRRKGEPRTSRTRVQTVIVPLEEVQHKHFGIGDHYWTEDPEASGATGSRRSTQQGLREASQTENGRSISVSLAESREPTPHSTVSRPTQKKRPREIRDDSDDEDLRFRFRRKR